MHLQRDRLTGCEQLHQKRQLAVEVGGDLLAQHAGGILGDIVGQGAAIGQRRPACGVRAEPDLGQRLTGGAVACELLDRLG